MSNIPEHILLQIRRFAAEGMPLEEIAFMTRIEPDIIKAELAKGDPFYPIPPEHTAMIRELAREEMPVGRIAFMTHMSESFVHEVLNEAGITPIENPTEAQGSSR